MTPGLQREHDEHVHDEHEHEHGHDEDDEHVRETGRDVCRPPAAGSAHSIDDHGKSHGREHDHDGDSHSGHSHGIPGRRSDGSVSPAARFRGALAITFGLTAGLFVVELISGLISGSLALVADAGHMATDVVALGASLVATRIAGQPDSSGRRTYGRYRAEVFSSGLAVLLMVGVGVFVVWEAIGRIGDDTHVEFGVMIVIGIIGLLVNLVGLILLRRGSRESLNVRGAYLEVLGDAAGSVGVLVAAVLIASTGNPIWDVVVAAAIGVFVLYRAIGLGRQVLAVLGQQVPKDIDIDALHADLSAIAGVSQVHDLHIWALTSGMNVATAHLVARPEAHHHEVLDSARDVLAEGYGISHATLQVEPADHTACGEIGW